jgi:LacI family transcriptional regulator
MANLHKRNQIGVNPMSRIKKVTMQEIADKVRVSKFAVSKALSGKSGISTTTREKIFMVASQFGYFNHKNKIKIQNPPTDDIDKKMVGILIPDIRIWIKICG